MAARVHLNSNHLVISKAGYDAGTPSLPDSQKVFDSNWGFYSSILFRGFSQFPPGWMPVSGEPTGYQTILFPYALNYVPAYMLFVTGHGNPNVSAASKFVLSPPIAGDSSLYPYGPVAYNDRIVCPHNWCHHAVTYADGGFENRDLFGLLYFVFGM